ncbi:MAG: hypothetical protein ACRDWI_11280 [Jiangellaceae bacterium]
MRCPSSVEILSDELRPRLAADPAAAGAATRAVLTAARSQGAPDAG